MGCKCFKEEREIKTKSRSTKHKSLISSPERQISKIISEIYEQASSPSLISDDIITVFHKIPSDKFQSNEEVFNFHGFTVDYDNRLGEGGYGTVYKGKRIYTREQIACKIIENATDEKNKLNIKNELFVMEKVKHPHLIRMYDHFVINKNLYIFMELASKGSLRNLAKNEGPFTEGLCKKWLAEIASAIKYMHDLGIAHRDIKLNNILIDKNDNLKIADFGLSRVGYKPNKGGEIKVNKIVGTQAYLSPEMLSFQPYRLFPPDIWALGVLLYVLINKTLPFDETKLDSMLQNQLERKYVMQTEYTREPISPELIDLFQQMLEPNPRKRITIDGLIQHPWIKTEYDKVREKIEADPGFNLNRCDHTKLPSSLLTLNTSTKTNNSTYLS